MTWQVGSTENVNWEVGTTSDTPAHAILQATEYRHGQTCTLQVFGAKGTYWIIYSPTTNPLDPLAVLPAIGTRNLDVNGDGTINITADRGIIRYGQTGYLYMYRNGAEPEGYSTFYPVVLLPENGKQYVTLSDPLVLPEEGVYAIPDLAAGDQVVWWNALPSGNVTIYTDRSFVTDGSVETFLVEAHVEGVGYTNTEIQNVAYDGSVSTWESEPLYIRDSSGNLVLLSNKTNISYVIKQGHSLTGTIVTSGNGGVTNEQGVFSLSDIEYAPASPVTVILRWETEGVSRFIIAYTELVAGV
jgi:hypothetical protein